MKKTHLRIWAPVVAFYALITFVSGLSSDKIAAVTTFYPFAGFDKVVHFSEYFILGVLLTRALTLEEYQHRLKRHWYIYFVAAIPVMSFVDEIHQFFVPARSMDILDWVADMSGASVGAFALVLFLRVWRAKTAEQSDLTEKSDPRARESTRMLLPAVILAIAIQFLFTRENISSTETRLSQFITLLPDVKAMPFLHLETTWQGTLFFIFGVFYFRFLIWEATGKARGHQFAIWGIGFVVFLFISLWDSLFPAILGGIANIPAIPSANFVGGAAALFMTGGLAFMLRLLERGRGQRVAMNG